MRNFAAEQSGSQTRRSQEHHNSSTVTGLGCLRMLRTCCQDEVAADALCPCGKNTVKCPGEDVCLPKDVADVICPCKAGRWQLDLCEPRNAPMLLAPALARSHKRLAASWTSQPQAKSPDFRQPALHRATLAPVARIPSAALIRTTCLDCSSLSDFVRNSTISIRALP